MTNRYSTYLSNGTTSGQLLRANSHPNGVIQKFAGQLLDGGGPGGTEHQRLSLLVNLRNDLANVRLEPQIQLKRF